MTILIFHFQLISDVTSLYMVGGRNVCRTILQINFPKSHTTFKKSIAFICHLIVTIGNRSFFFHNDLFSKYVRSLLSNQNNIGVYFPQWHFSAFFQK